MARQTANATMAEIARRCRLSKATISRALSMPSDRSPVTPQTRERIMRVAQDLEYRPNWRARALSRGKTHTVGLVISGLLPQHEAIPHQMLESFSRVLRGSGYHLALVPIDGALDWRDLVFGGHVDGCAIINDPPAEVLDEIARSPLPAVAMNAAPNTPLPVVTADDFQGGKIVGRHLYDLGHRHVGMYVNKAALPHYSQRERLRGLIDGMGEGATIEFVCDTHHAAMNRLLDREVRPSAIVCYSHYEAVPVLAELSQRGLQVPQDMSLITFNDVFPLDCLRPPITRIAIPADRIGTDAAHQLLTQIEGSGRPLTPKPLVLPESLILRDSCAAAPAAAA